MTSQDPDPPSSDGNSSAPEGPASPEGGASDPAGEGRRRRRHRRRGRRSGEREPKAAADGGAEGAEEGTQEAVEGAPDNFAGAPESWPVAELPEDAGEVFAGVLSGDFDREEVPEAPVASEGETVAEAAAPVKPSEPPRRVLAPDADAPKLQKVLAQSGVGSRRDLEQMIVEGRVSVNGQPAHVGQRVSFGDRIAVDGKPVRVRITPPLPRVLAYHKPVGEVVTHDDPQQRPTVFRRLPRLQHGKWQSVGRLDINTEGLLLFTNSGDLANRLMHPRFGVEREYAVRVLGLLSDEERERLLQGVDIDGQPAAFSRVDDGGGEGANHWYRVVITEGRHREVRRLFESVGHVVSRLIRIRYGSVVLPRGLRRGAWVDLASDDVKALRMATGLGRPAGKGPAGPNAGAHAGPSAGGPPQEKSGRSRRRRGRRSPDDPMQMPGQAQMDDGEGEFERIGPIPNPLQQTYDKRAIQQERKRRDMPEDGPIPNPLQQTYDRRAVQGERRKVHEPDEDGPIPNPLQQTYDKRFVQQPKGGGGGGGGRGRRKAASPTREGGAQRQPDPMRTSVGYIGADAFHKKGARKGGRGGRGGGR